MKTSRKHMHLVFSSFHHFNIFNFFILSLLMVGVTISVLSTQQQQKLEQLAANCLLKTQGARLVDCNGKSIILRGAMMESAFAYIKPWQAGQNPLTTLNSNTFNAMSAWHM